MSTNTSAPTTKEKKIQLCVFEKKDDESSGSGYCQELETFFRASAFTSYEVKFTTQFSAPKGKLPYIIEQPSGKAIGDSHFIIRHLIKEGIVRDLDAELTPAQKAESRAWQAWIEELIYPAVGWTRVGYPENLTVLKEEAFQKLPFGIRHLVSWLVPRRIQSALIAHGVGRHTREEVDNIIEEFVKSLTVRLGESEGVYFHGGANPTIIDCIVYGFLVNGLRMKSNPGYTKLILVSEMLRQYIAHGTRLWFPEYSGILQMVTPPEAKITAGGSSNGVSPS
jgi:glutathione S-transferase